MFLAGIDADDVWGQTGAVMGPGINGLRRIGGPGSGGPGRGQGFSLAGQVPVVEVFG